MKFVIIFACLVALAAAEEKKSDVDVNVDQDVAEWHSRGYYGQGYGHDAVLMNYNPYGYSSPSNEGYFGPGYVVAGSYRGRRSVAKNADQTVPTSYNPYGYSSPSNIRYYGPGYIAGQYNRDRRSVDDVIVADADQVADESNNRGWGYNHGYHSHGYPSYYRSYGSYYRYPTSYSYSYHN